MQKTTKKNNNETYEQVTVDVCISIYRSLNIFFFGKVGRDTYWGVGGLKPPPWTPKNPGD